MGEMQVSAHAGEELVAIGLGSCIGLALVDQRAGVAALAHIVLPASQGAAGPAAKYADLAVPELLRQVQQTGAQKHRLQVVMVGGAKMFAIGGGLDIGARNDSAVRDALRQHQLRIHAEATGGSRGRTLRVYVGSGHVTVQEAGGSSSMLLAGSDAPGRTPHCAPGFARLGVAGAQA